MEEVLNVLEGLKRFAGLTENKEFKAPFNVSYRVSKYMRIL